MQLLLIVIEKRGGKRDARYERTRITLRIEDTSTLRVTARIKETSTLRVITFFQEKLPTLRVIEETYALRIIVLRIEETSTL